MSAAIEEFVEGASPELGARVHYALVPCDGTVVVGDESDIGCNGHKNAAGQMKVAAYLAPIISEIMGWEV